MSTQDRSEPTRRFGPRRSLARLSTRPSRVGWVCLAAAALFVAFALAGRIGVVEAALATVAVAIVAVVAPRRRSSRGRTRRGSGPSDTAVGPQAVALLSGLADPVVVLDRRGVVLAFNARAAQAMPIARAGEPFSFALRVPEVLDAVKAVAAGRGPQVVAYVERVPVERWTEAHVTAAPIGAAGEEVIVVSLRDFTEQRRSERMRADFVANASHELRTPLASLLGFIETLQGPAKADPVAREKFLDIMRTQANRMSRLIDDLLSLSRIELKAHVRPQASVDLTEIASSVIDALAPLADERNVTVTVAAPDGEVWARGDRDELIRVAENLIENAIKYGSSGGRVEIAITLDGEHAVRLAVRDYGPGIAPEHLPRLTERFYRADVADSRDKGGTGLGLALVKHVLQRHGGRLTIESVYGDGATFTVTLDRASASESGRSLRRAS